MFDGSTPLMTAAKYDQAEVFRYLHNSGGNIDDRCNSNLSYKDTIEETELNLLKEITCPKNGSISHLLAIHNSYNIIKYLLNIGFDHWQTNDSNGLTPSHYAFCCNSNNFINLVVFANKRTGHLNLNVKSPNGSTSFHSAAICKSLILSHYVDMTIRLLPDEVDNSNRSILQYGLMPPVSQEDAIEIDRVGTDYYSDLLLRVTINNKHNYLRVDNYGRNFLHYAASSGNYWTFLKILQIFKKTDIDVLLNNQDNKGNTPLKEAFNALTRHGAFESLKIPVNCSLNELFSTTCKKNLSVILLPQEYFILTVSKYLSTTNYFMPSNVKDFLILAINKSRLYPILVLKTYASKVFHAIVSSSTEMLNLLAKSDMHFIAELIFKADNSLRCNKTESPLHQLVLNAMNGKDILPLNSFLIPLFKRFSSQYLDCCYDKEGYNILHRAAMGGNIQTVKLMITKGMNFSYPMRNDQNVLELCIYSSPFLKNGHVPSYYVSGPRFHILEYVFQSETWNISIDRTRNVDFDSTADLLLNEMSRSSQKNRVKQLLCDGKNIGLLHIGAAKGLLKFLKRVLSIFGTHILSCSDRFNVSVYYLAQLYRQTDIVKWMNSIQLKFRTPTKVIQNVLIYNLISNYMTVSQHDWTCFLDYTFKYRALMTKQAMKCLARVPSTKILFKNEYLRNVSAFVYKSIFFNLAEINEYTRNSEYRYFIEMWKNTNQTAAIEFTQLFGLCHMKRFANSIRKQLILFHQEDGEFFFRYLQTKGMQTTEPLCDYEINELYQSVISRTYQDFKKLQVRRDLHKEWLHDMITEKIGIDFDVRGFFKFITKRLQITLKQSDNAMQFGTHHIMERINFAVSEFNDFGISLTHEETCVLVFNFILQMLSTTDYLQSSLKILFRYDKLEVVHEVECFFKLVIDQVDDYMETYMQKINSLKSLIDKALQNNNWDMGDFLLSSFHFVIIKIRDLYTKYFEKGIEYTVIL
ncbi:Hypothetical predicted protein [Mytilus galloprovincialis]|uniref:Uncharacterized protein n=1 Tax=Mytilus galloprovincialis TaxID=29158 RepID=A0A8B6EXF2_MYTGA|nr:Hypothetical predicted protein [Mytilus galloprovincialis]